MGEVRIERSGAVAWLRYTSSPADLLDVAGLASLRRAVDAVVSDPQVRVVVWSGLPGRYPAQMDPSEGAAMADAAPPMPGWLAAAAVRCVVPLLRWIPSLRRVLDTPSLALRAGYFNLLAALDALERSEKVTVAVIDGPAFGGGLEIALACDLRVCSDDASVWFAQPELLGGVMVGFGASQRLPRLVGEARALELLLVCDAIDPETALRWGLVNRVFEADRFVVEVDALLERLARRSPVAVGATRRAVRRALGALRPDHEVRDLAAVWGTTRAREGLVRVAEITRQELRSGTRRSLPELLAEFGQR